MVAKHNAKVTSKQQVVALTRECNCEALALLMASV